MTGVNPAISHVIPALIRPLKCICDKCLEAKARGDQEIVAWGDGSPTREFLYVEDAAEGILLAPEQAAPEGGVVMGTIAQELLQQGEQRGLRQGLLDGIELANAARR